MSSTEPKKGMTRSKWIVAGIVATMLTVTGISLGTNLFGTGLSRELVRKSPQPQATLEKVEIVSGGTTHVFQTEVMKTNEERAKGLMFRQFMPQDRGMLFDFIREEPVSMWMRNTYLPLDMLFIKSDGTIHHIHERAQPLDETTISSNGNVRFVLEINGGVAAKLGMKPGDKVRHSLIK
ncbi:MAG: DUF192 domain-containing protein [Beijerinckiaceae bacterium]